MTHSKALSQYVGGYVFLKKLVKNIKPIAKKKNVSLLILMCSVSIFQVKLFFRLFNRFMPSQPVSDNTNVNMIELGDRLFALTESLSMNEINPDSLTVKERVSKRYLGYLSVGVLSGKSVFFTLNRFRSNFFSG